MNAYANAEGHEPVNFGEVCPGCYEPRSAKHRIDDVLIVCSDCHKEWRMNQCPEYRN